MNDNLNMSYAYLMSYLRAHRVEFAQKAANGDPLALDVQRAWDKHIDLNTVFTESRLRSVVLDYINAQHRDERAYQAFAPDELSEP